MDKRVRYTLLAVAISALPYMASTPALARTTALSHSSGSRNCIFDHQSLWTPAGTCRPRAKHYPATVKGGVERAIYDGTLTFGIPYSVLLQIASCESGLNPRASNGSHFGVFQFAPNTFQLGAQRLLQETGIVARNYWNALDSTYVAGYYFAEGQSLSWTCEPSYR